MYRRRIALKIERLYEKLKGLQLEENLLKWFFVLDENLLNKRIGANMKKQDETRRQIIFLERKIE